MKKFFWFPVVFVLSSCASYMAFEEPVNGERARVRVLGTDSVGEVRASQGKDSSVELLGMSAAKVVFMGHAFIGSSGFTDRSLGMPPSALNVRAAEFYVKAGEAVTLASWGNTSYITGYRNVCHEETTWSTEGKGDNKTKVKHTTTTCGDEAVYDRCKTAVRFIPEKNIDYEVVYSESGVANCSLDVYTLDARGNRIARPK